MTQRIMLFLALFGALGLAQAGSLSSKERKQIQQQIGKLAGEGDWDQIGPLLERLGDANDKATFRFMVKVAEKGPPEAHLAEALRAGAEKMDDRRVQSEMKRAATGSHSPEVRRELIALLGDRGDWETLIAAMGDKVEEIASTAAWKLIDNRVEDAVEPMIENMEQLDRTQGGIWDVYRNGLAKLLGTRCGSGVEYRSLWQLVKERGGLEQVRPSTGGGEPAAAGGSVTLFGREIECTRVVFVLDISGSMEAIDPNQADPLAGNTRARGAPDSQNPQPRGLTRLQRAQAALKNVIDHLPESYQINIVAYSSRVQMWRAQTEDGPPVLHPLNDANRAAAKEFVDGFKPEGVTVTHRALERAFEVKNVRCIYLLSDGFATEDGQTPIPTDTILQAIDRAGGDRHITIHTMGFEGADREMMRAVADHTGGRYSDIR